MSTYNDNIKWLILKNNKVNWIPAAKQTLTLRDKTNTKIRELGFKFNNVKNLFDQMSLRRDFLFTVGKILVNEYKDIKTGISLLSQFKRSKEALICFYAEFFYDEIFTSNSPVLKKFVEYNQSQIIINKVDDQLPIKNEIDEVHRNTNTKKIEENNRINILQNIVEKNEVSQKSIFDKITFNKEIDGYDFYTNDFKNSYNEFLSNKFFDYEDLLKPNK